VILARKGAKRRRSVAGLRSQTTKTRLREDGFVEGQNLTIEYRWAEDHPERLPAMAADLMRRRVAVIVATGAPIRQERQRLRPRRTIKSLDDCVSGFDLGPQATHGDADWPFAGPW
jgi:hypothetical protein